MSRRKIFVILISLLWIVGLGTVFSFSTLQDFHPLGFFSAFAERTIFETLDYIVSNFMMPFGGVLVALLAGWGLKRSAVLDELQVRDSFLFGAWRILVRYVVPAAIAWVFVVNL